MWSTINMDLEDSLLMMPGPVSVSTRVLRAMSKPMINHQSTEFAGIYTDCKEILSSVFQTKNNIVVINGSGTAGMEAAVGSLTSNGDKVIAIENGKFGERFKDLAALYAEVVPVVFEWGQSVDLEVVKEKLEEGAKAITLVHNETSAGILNPAAEIGKLAKKHDALFIMDGITSIGGDDVKIDEWGVDVAIVGSQKCLAAPPGLAAGSVSEKAIEVMKGISKRPYYNDLLARLKEKIFRIGCVGVVSARGVLSTIQQLEIVLNKRGYIYSLGAGTEAAIKVIDKSNTV
jgi:aspartate aminotransferase-like enzyme